MKYLYNENKEYGLLGNHSEEGFHVGDVYHVKDKEEGSEANLVVIYDDVKQRYTMLGLMAYSISEIKEHYEIKKVLKYEDFSLEGIYKLDVFDGANFHLENNEY